MTLFVSFREVVKFELIKEISYRTSDPRVQWKTHWHSMWSTIQKNDTKRRSMIHKQIDDEYDDWWQWRYLMSQNVMKWWIDENDVKKNGYYRWWCDDNDFAPLWRQEHDQMRRSSLEQYTLPSLCEPRTSSSKNVFVTWFRNFFGLRSRLETNDYQVPGVCHTSDYDSCHWPDPGNRGRRGRVFCVLCIFLEIFVYCIFFWECTYPTYTCGRL